MSGDGAKPASWEQRSSSAAAERLQLQVSTNIEELVGITLEAVVPGYADAAIVSTAESLFQGGVPAVDRPVRADASGQVVVRRAGARFAWGGLDASILPSGEVVVFTGGSPYARCVSGGEPVAFPRPDGPILEHPSAGSREVLSRYASFLVVPLKADGTVVGLLTLARDSVRPAFSEGDLAGIMRIAASAGTGIATMAELQRHRSVSDALQKGLLVAEPVPPEQLDVAGKCLPSAGQLIGGDWYDIIALPNGRTGIVVGDVMGHGAEAAVIMAQLRSAARVLAQMDTEPSELLARLNGLIPTLNPEPLATCLYAVIDAAEQCCTLSAAGHLPPVLAIPGPGARVLDLPSGLSLGIGSADYGQARLKLRPGSIIALYTDGLVETRARPYEQGIAVLRTELARAEGPLEDTRDAIIRSLAGADCQEDDVTLVLARIPS